MIKIYPYSKCIYKPIFMAIFLLISITSVVTIASAEPTLTRTLDSATVEPGDSVHVRLDLTLDTSQVLGTIKERCNRTTPDVHWTISNITASPEFVAIRTSDTTGEYDFGVGLGILPAGTYYVEYDLIINPETPVATYDLEGSFVSFENPTPGIAATGGTQITVFVEPVGFIVDKEDPFYNYYHVPSHGGSYSAGSEVDILLNIIELESRSDTFQISLEGPDGDIGHYTVTGEGTPTTEFFVTIPTGTSSGECYIYEDTGKLDPDYFQVTAVPEFLNAGIPLIFSAIGFIYLRRKKGFN